MDHMSYADFGIAFITHAVTPERVADAIAHIAGDEVVVGPLSAGPGGFAQAGAVGRIGPARVTTRWAELLEFAAVLPIELDLEVVIARARHRYRGTMEVSLRLSIRTARPLILVIDLDELRPSDVDIQLRADGIAASVLQRIGDMENEIRRQVVRTVNARISSEDARAQREIDLLALIERSWPGGRAPTPQPAP